MRPHWLTPATGGRRLGRFGWKVGAAVLLTQPAAAFSLDIGLSTHLFPAGSGDCNAAQSTCQRAPGDGEPATGEPQISDKILDLVTFYSRHFAVRLCRHATDPALQRSFTVRHRSQFGR